MGLGNQGLQGLAAGRQALQQRRHQLFHLRPVVLPTRLLQPLRLAMANHGAIGGTHRLEGMGQQQQLFGVVATQGLF